MINLKHEDIILFPIITEKTNKAREERKQFCFQVHINSNKFQIKQALEKLYKVKVTSCHTIIVKPKRKKSISKRKSFSGFTSRKKKAIVQLKQGSVFPFFENL